MPKADSRRRVHDRRTNPDAERPFLSDRQEPGTDGGRRVWIPPPVGGRQVSHYANGTRAFAIPAQQESHIKTAEMSTEQNYNMIDGMMNNAPSMEELEARAKAGEQISLLDVPRQPRRRPKSPSRPKDDAEQKKTITRRQ